MHRDFSPGPVPRSNPAHNNNSTNNNNNDSHKAKHRVERQARDQGRKRADATLAASRGTLARTASTQTDGHRLQAVSPGRDP